MRVSRVRGTIDYYGTDIKHFRYLEKQCRNVAKIFGYQEIMTPIFEETVVFTRSAGETSDIVNKEMYTFLDKGERSITLRPEGTAPIVRALVENKLYVTPGLKKFYYLGPNFRYERPKAGRFRQFHQFGIEAFGDDSPLLDADVINMAMNLFQKCGLTNIKVMINTIGSMSSRQKYAEALQAHFKDQLSTMCHDCQTRFLKNPLRMLDCKIDKNHPLMENVPLLKDFLSEEDQNYFKQLLETLDFLKINYQVNEFLVRGLDYYENDVFEFYCDDVNSSIYGEALGGGGRYNSLTSTFGGPELKGIGFGLGIERLMILLKEQGVIIEEDGKPQIVVMTIGEKCKLAGLQLANYLRKNDYKVEIDYYAHQLKAQFKLSERVEADYLIIIGENEINEKQVIIKDVIKNQEVKVVNQQINEFFGIGEKYEN